MTETTEHLIQARFDAVANPLADADWADVLARARGAGPRRAPARIALAAAVAVLAATVTAVAFGWPGRVDFFKAPPAPQSVKAFFGAHNVAPPGGVSPDSKVGQAREIMTATFDADNLPPTNPKQHTLYVAPRTDGGFCYLWTEYGGSCADPENAEQAKTDPAARPLGLSWLENDYAGFVDGWVRPEAKTVEARFADGSTVSIPVTWVSAPIDAGFLAYVIPAAHLTRADPLASVVALDQNGNVVERQDFRLANPLDEDVMQTLPDGTKLSLPRRAQADRAREIVNYRTENGARVYVWVMPRTGGGDCYLFGTGAGGGQGCTSPRWLARGPAVNGVAYRGNLYFAQVRPGIASVELRYRNGAVERVQPVDGFIGRELRPGTRLSEVVGSNRAGRAVFTEHVPPSG